MTLDEFISWSSRRWLNNAYVEEPGFKSLYVRLNMRYVQGKKQRVLDLANAEAEHPGKGAFTRLVSRLRHDYPHLGLYAESVLNVRMRPKLLSLGFVYVGPCEESPCYFLAPTKGGADAEEESTEEKAQQEA